MKYKDVADAYDKLFKNDVSAQSWEGWNRGEPMPLVNKLENFIASGDVLDIGAGAGQNCVYLAGRGFNVLATDISAVAIERIQAKARAKNVFLRTEIHDIVDEELKNDFDVKKIQQRTKPMGFNIISTFTKRGDFYSKNPSTKKFYIDSNADLDNLYSNWTVHMSFEKKGSAYQKGPNGATLFNVFASMLSQKQSPS